MSHNIFTYFIWYILVLVYLGPKALGSGVSQSPTCLPFPLDTSLQPSADVLSLWISRILVIPYFTFMSLIMVIFLQNSVNNNSFDNQNRYSIMNRYINPYSEFEIRLLALGYNNIF